MRSLVEEEFGTKESKMNEKRIRIFNLNLKDRVFLYFDLTITTSWIANRD